VSGTFPRRWRSASSTVCSVVLFAVAGCGGSDDGQRPAPALPPAVGDALAAETADVDEALAAGDTPRARAEAEDLAARVEAAIERGEVPRALRGELRAAARRLLDLIPPPPPPPPEPPAPEPPPSPPPAPAPEEDACAELREGLDLLEEQRDQLEGDDPGREALEEQRDAIKDALKECERENRGGGEEDEDDGGDD